MRIKNKKAVSALVATVMIILITMAGVAIVWQIVMPLIKTSMETSKLCSDAQLMVNAEGGYTYYDGNVVSVQITRGEIAVKELNGTQIKVFFDGNSKTFDTRVLETIKPIPGINEDWTYTISKTEIDGIPSGVAVAAILRIGIKDRMCQMTPKTALEISGT